MKRKHRILSILVLIALFVPTITQAGFKAKTYMLGGHMQLKNQTVFTEDGTQATDMAFSPFYGYFLRNNIAIGPAFTYAYRNRDGFAEPETETDIGLFGRIYTGVDLFFEASLRYNRRSSSEGNIGRGGFTGVAMGYSIMLSERVGMEPRVKLDFGIGGDRSNEVVSGFTIGVYAFLPSAEKTD